MNPITALLTSMFTFAGVDLPKQRSLPKKLCLQCNKPHQHNNAFCSPQHCKDYREARKAK